jgi:hypothetical protein
MPVPAAASLEAALRLTAIALLLRPMGPWFVQPVLLALATLTLVSPRLLRDSRVWFGVALAIAIRIADDWPLADNHIYLLGYWALAIALALRSTDAAAHLAISSRWLVGLAFVCAVLWKAVWSHDFLDQRFFRVTLLTDPRFTELTMLVGGLTAQQLEANRAALTPLPQGAELLNAPPVEEPTRLRVLAAISTWGILALEGLVAALMLAALGPGTAWARHAGLLVFCAVTYAWAPVAGFGWLLLVMGLAQARATAQWLRRAYVGAFLGVLFYTEVPWPDLVLDYLR